MTNINLPFTHSGSPSEARVSRLSSIKLIDHEGNMFGMGLIRILLAVAVVIGHTSQSFFGYHITGGVVAVQVFYIFSGFYMFMILSESYSSTVKFYRSRALRLYPTYLIVAFISLLATIASHGNFNYKAWEVLGLLEKMFVVFISITIFFQDVLMFLGVDPETGHFFFTKLNFHEVSMPAYMLLLVPQAWSLGVEVTFYLFVPFLVRRKTVTLCAIVLASLVLRYVMIWQGFKHDPWSYRFFPLELALFLFGGVGYRAYRKWKHSDLLRRFAPYVTTVAVFSVLFYQLLPIGGNLLRMFVYYALMAMALPFIFHSSCASRRDRELGELSYPVYLTHLLVLTFINLFKNSMSIQLHKQFICIPVIALSIVVSILINKYVQQPIDSLRRS